MMSTWTFRHFKSRLLLNNLSNHKKTFFSFHIFARVQVSALCKFHEFFVQNPEIPLRKFSLYRRCIMQVKHHEICTWTLKIFPFSLFDILWLIEKKTWSRMFVNIMHEDSYFLMHLRSFMSKLEKITNWTKADLSSIFFLVLVLSTLCKVFLVFQKTAEHGRP